LKGLKVNNESSVDKTQQSFAPLPPPFIFSSKECFGYFMSVRKVGETIIARTVGFANIEQGKQMIEFDGKTDDDLPLRPGLYTFGLKATDSNGLSSQVSSFDVKIFF